MRILKVVEAPPCWYHLKGCPGYSIIALQQLCWHVVPSVLFVVTDVLCTCRCSSPVIPVKCSKWNHRAVYLLGVLYIKSRQHAWAVKWSWLQSATDTSTAHTTVVFVYNTSAVVFCNSKSHLHSAACQTNTQPYRSTVSPDQAVNWLARPSIWSDIVQGNTPLLL